MTPTRCIRPSSGATIQLEGAEVTLPDVRAGFSAVLGAAVAEQPSVLHGIHHIERGYHRPFDQFASLGLTIRRG